MRSRARFAEPAPPRTFVSCGAGWGYGVGCGVGLFLGMGVALTPPSVVFGAGAGPGLYCGVGFGAGLVGGIGSSFIPIGLSSAFFYGPRLDAAEHFVRNPPPRFSMLWSKFLSSFSALPFRRRPRSQPSQLIPYEESDR